MRQILFQSHVAQVACKTAKKVLCWLHNFHLLILFFSHPQCRLPSQSYVFQEQMSLEIIHRPLPPQNTVSSRNTDSSGSNVLQLNPRSGALYLTETGYEQLIQDNSMSCPVYIMI